MNTMDSVLDILFFMTGFIAGMVTAFLCTRYAIKTSRELTTGETTLFRPRESADAEFEMLDEETDKGVPDDEDDA